MRKSSLVFCIILPLVLFLAYFTSINSAEVYASPFTGFDDSYPPPVPEQATGDNRTFLPIVSRGWSYLPNISHPSYSISIYIEDFGTDNNNLYNAGCELGQKARSTKGAQDYFIYLGFGQAYLWPEGAGAQLLGSNEYVTKQAIKDAAVEYARGFYICTGTTDVMSTVTIGMGVSNSSQYSTLFAHGYGWAELVKEASDQLAGTNYSDQAMVVGAGNLELEFNDAYSTWQWVEGYKTYLTGNHLESQFPIYVVGDAAGCSTLHRNSTCGTVDFPDWNEWYVWYINYGSGISFPIPMIYYDWIQAEQWMLLSQYSPNDPMLIIGEMTQQGACAQRPDDESCTGGGNNSPYEGYGQLYTVLSSDPTTRSVIDALVYSTDITYKP